MKTPIKQHLIDPEICIRCYTCEMTCTLEAISHDDNNVVVDAAICGSCLDCITVCPTGSIDEWRIVIPRIEIALQRLLRSPVDFAEQRWRRRRRNHRLRRGVLDPSRPLGELDAGERDHLREVTLDKSEATALAKIGVVAEEEEAR